MSRRRIIVLIDELNLLGMEVQAGGAIGDVLQVELTRLLSEQQGTAYRGGKVERTYAPPISAGPTVPVRSMGVQLAQRVHGAVESAASVAKRSS
jgi:hypothetical protein